MEAANSEAATWAMDSAGHWFASLRCQHRPSIHRVHTRCPKGVSLLSRRQVRAQYLGTAETNPKTGDVFSRRVRVRSTATGLDQTWRQAGLLGSTSAKWTGAIPNSA